MSVDLSLPDLPRVQPLADPKAYLQAAAHWHFSPETGSPYCHKRAQALDFNPLTDMKALPNISRPRSSNDGYLADFLMRNSGLSASGSNQQPAKPGERLSRHTLAVKGGRDV